MKVALARHVGYEQVKVALARKVGQEQVKVALARLGPDGCRFGGIKV